jgi:hypothetical protein
MEGKGRESHRGCLLPRVDKQKMGRCGGQVARRVLGGGERPSGGAAGRVGACWKTFCLALEYVRGYVTMAAEMGSQRPATGRPRAWTQSLSARGGEGRWWTAPWEGGGGERDREIGDEREM